MQAAATVKIWAEWEVVATLVKAACKANPLASIIYLPADHKCMCHQTPLLDCEQQVIGLKGLGHGETHK
jgi:hypothetical protein